jgi:hypothetical protein
MSVANLYVWGILMWKQKGHAGIRVPPKVYNCTWPFGGPGSESTRKLGYFRKLRKVFSNSPIHIFFNVKDWYIG